MVAACIDYARDLGDKGVIAPVRDDQQHCRRRAADGVVVHRHLGAVADGDTESRSLRRRPRAGRMRGHKPAQVRHRHLDDLAHHRERNWREAGFELEFEADLGANFVVGNPNLSANRRERFGAPAPYDFEGRGVPVLAELKGYVGDAHWRLHAPLHLAFSERGHRLDSRHPAGPAHVVAHHPKGGFRRRRDLGPGLSLRH